MTIAVVTDSTSDVPLPLAEDLGIEVIPAIVIIGGEAFEDNLGLSRETFYLHLPEMSSPPTTATPAIGTFEAAYDRLLAAGAEHILSLHVAGTLSGVLNAAHTAAQSFPGRVTAMDSQQVSMGLGFQAMAAAEAAQEGAPWEAVLHTVQSLRRRLHLMAMLDTLEYLKRSGRISWVRSNLGSLLRIKPFVEVRDGQVLRTDQARTRRKGLDLLEAHLRNLGPLERLAILHTGDPNLASEFLARLDLDVQLSPLIINVTTVIGAHVGPGALGFAAVARHELVK